MKRLQLLAAIAMCIFGCALLTAAFALPPPDPLYLIRPNGEMYDVTGKRVSEK